MSQSVQAPLTLDQVSKLFSNWRETRPGKGPIPESLLKAVARLHVSHSSRTIAKALRLNQTDMKIKLKRFKAEPSHLSDIFDEFIAHIAKFLFWTVSAAEPVLKSLRRTCLMH